ncbi:MAG TPA: hypothetical protein VMV41_11060 [Cellulomonadaceae bacterium]|nr:hypothetical protein [Cellulomonadaceae bacterium]
MPEDDDLNFAILSLSLLENHGTGITTEDVAQARPANLPPRRDLIAERAASRKLLDAQPVRSTATRHNRFRERIGFLYPEYGHVHGADVLNSAATIAYGSIAPLAGRIATGVPGGRQRSIGELARRMVALAERAQR